MEDDVKTVLKGVLSTLKDICEQQKELDYLLGLHLQKIDPEASERLYAFADVNRLRSEALHERLKYLR